MLTNQEKHNILDELYKQVKNAESHYIRLRELHDYMTRNLVTVEEIVSAAKKPDPLFQSPQN